MGLVIYTVSLTATEAKTLAGLTVGVEGEGALLPVGGLVAEELELEVEVFEDVLVDDGEDVVLVEEEEVSIDVASELL